MTIVGWVDTAEIAEDFWPEAADLTDTALTSYLQSAYEQCVAFLPDPESPPTVAPQRWGLAQIMQARALHRSNVAGSGDAMGGEGLSVTVFPMDWTVKNLLRPSKVGRVT